MATLPPKSRRLQPIQQIALQREQSAAQAIAMARQRHQEERNKLDELKSFADEYIRQLAPGAGLHNSRQLINWHQFFGRLQLAIQQQEQLVVDLGRQLDKALEHWRNLHLKRQSLDKVIQSAKYKEEIERDKRLQRELDDRSAQKSRPNANPDK